MAISEVTSAKLLVDGVLINVGESDQTTLPSGNTGFLRDLYNEWLAQPNTPDPVETLAEAKIRRKALLDDLIAYGLIGS